MLSKSIEKALNKQITLEAYASFYYLSMASWCDTQGYTGTSKFLYIHADEEKMHMLRIFHYINDTGGHALTPSIDKLPHHFKSLKNLFQDILKHEQNVTESINELVGLCLSEKDYSTYNFLQWYVAEQHEEEKLIKVILDKIKIIGESQPGIYMIDKEIETMSGAGGGKKENN
jgi:ferritin